MLRIETGLLALSLLIAFVYPSLGARWFEKVERGFSRLSRHRGMSVALVGIAALALRAALLPILPIPEPIVHDEFGYLLAADTFTHGRLTNPTHPLWKHFESFNIIVKPTYQSYPQPAQGLLLAAGRLLFGHPFWGVWLSAGILCATICWMLQAWLPARWALLGGLLAVLHFGVFSYWADSYWGGALGAIGGALVLGALPRIKRSHRVRDALLMAVGLALLANTRPYEGLIFSLPIAVALFAWMFGKSAPPLRLSLYRVFLPICLLLTITVASMGYYFWRVTGNPLRLPYAVERQTYAIAPYFLWQPLHPRPAYNNAVIEKMYTTEEMNGYHLFRGPAGMMVKLFWSWRFYLGLTLTLPLLMLVFALPYGFSWKDISKRTRFLLLIFGISIAGLEIETFYAPHYPAPVAGLVLALALIAMRRVQKWRWRDKPAGLFLARAVPSICVVMFVLRAAAAPLHLPLDGFYAPAWYQTGPRSFGREIIERELEHLPGRQLVIVHYKPDHEPFEEWVYNEADIDRSKIVWAREMDAAENQKLTDYFGDRQIWILQADEKPPRLNLYSQVVPALGMSQQPRAASMAK
jgi:hypothetical protein